MVLVRMIVSRCLAAIIRNVCVCVWFRLPFSIWKILQITHTPARDPELFTPVMSVKRVECWCQNLRMYAIFLIDWMLRKVSSIFRICHQCINYISDISFSIVRSIQHTHTRTHTLKIFCIERNATLWIWLNTYLCISSVPPAYGCGNG